MWTTLTRMAAPLCLTLFITACSNEPSEAPATQPAVPVVHEQPHRDYPPASPRDEEEAIPPAVVAAVEKGKALDTCSAILETHCTACHHTTRVCQKLGRKNKKGWQRTIKNMIRHGAQLTPVEVEALVQCLDQQSQGVKDYCQ